MNNLYRKLRKNSKALSPVVASIILIAVTVAVSVVVAAWMGGMTIGLMGSAEQVSVTNIAFTVEAAAADELDVMVQNAGGSAVTISNAFINGIAVPQAGWISDPVSATFTIDKASTMTFTLPLPTGIEELESGASYTVKLITEKGTSIVSAPVAYSP